MVRVFVVGVAMTKFDKPGVKFGDYTDWGKEAILAALKDSQVKIEEVELATAGFVYGDSTSGQRVIYEVGMTGIPIFNVNNNCSTGSSALLLAKELVECGKAHCALAVGFDKMQKGSLGSVFMDRANPMEKHVEAMAEVAEINASPILAQMFGNAGLEYMKKYGATPDHFAKIAWKNHKHSVNNPNSQFRDEYTLEQIKNSPKVFEPLTKLQCCPTSDGAAAVIVASENFVRSHGLEARAVEILGMEMATDLPSTFQDKSSMKIVGYDMSKLAADRLYKKTGKKPTDVQVVELHDCFSANELISYEALSLCPPGGAPGMIDRGDNTYGGKYVVNPSGGLISKGHPLGATGLAQCAELTWQLRGEAGPRQVPNAKLALQHNIGLGGAVVVALYQLGFPEYRNRNVSARKTAAATNEDGFIAAPFMHILQEAMLEDEDGLVSKFRGIYGLKITREDGVTGLWVINTKEGKGKIEFNGKDKPEVTFTIKDSDIIELLTGEIEPQKAFFQGKIKIQGNIGLALKLMELQRIAASKIEQLRAKHLKSKL
ncbi:sterol carrier protein 2 [Euwallacea similis]|uniref:sterol carrier protein 2 n=1 Tax=Euwallacea similis TaxID=1736056 RepID=UPI00344F6D84